MHAISNWANCWQLNLNIGKCEALAITNKQKPVKFSYYINGQSISWNNSVKYLGLLVDGKLNWSKQCRYAVSKANKFLNCLHHSMFGCRREAKYAAYKTIVWPTLEYTAVVWCPHYICDTKMIESLQNRAVRWICGSCWSPPTNSWTIPSNDCCSQLNLPTLQSRHQYLSTFFLHDIFNHHTSINLNNHCTFNSISSTRSHQLSLCPPQSTINSQRYSFFVNTVFWWNSVPLHILNDFNRKSFQNSLYNFMCVN